MTLFGSSRIAPTVAPLAPHHAGEVWFVGVELPTPSQSPISLSVLLGGTSFIPRRRTAVPSGNVTVPPATAVLGFCDPGIVRAPAPPPPKRGGTIIPPPPTPASSTSTATPAAVAFFIAMVTRAPF